MRPESDTNGPSVTWEVVHAAATGVQEAWDAIVDAYAGLVWAVTHSRHLNGPTAAEVSRLTWMRFQDRLGLISPEAIAGWLAETAERECIRLVRLLQTGGEPEVRTA
jgi:hypothetical protein